MKSKLSLAGKEWKSFFIEDIFEINSGRDIYDKERIAGSTPYVTATANNNGIGYFIDNINETLESECLSVNRNGSVGYCFYHQYPALYGNDTRKLRPKKKNKYVALFISLCITNQREKYGYGYKVGTARLKRQRILLPVDETNNPDWQFMEEYMRQKEAKILKITIATLKEHMGSSMFSKESLPEVNWKDFVFGDEFSIESTQSGIDKNKLIKETGNIPYITRTDVANGIDSFICIQNSQYKEDKGNVITIGLDTQTVFYQPKAFYTGQNIQIIRHDKLDCYNAQFLIVAIKKLVSKFSWGSYGATLSRLRKSKLYLPVTSTGEIDFQFMSSFMKRVEADCLKKAINFLYKHNEITPRM